MEAEYGEPALCAMMYMDDAVQATLNLMEAPAEKVKVRTSYNIGSMSFCPAQVASTIKTHIPEFSITYKPDFRQAIADSWPKSIDDSAARTDWGWKHKFGLEEMTEDIGSHLKVGELEALMNFCIKGRRWNVENSKG